MGTSRSTHQISQAHEEGFVSGQEAADVCGITYRRLNYWASIGLAPPTIDSTGSGVIRQYDLDALVRVKIVANLLDIGLRDSKGLRALLDQVQETQGSAQAVSGCVSIEVDPQCAKALIQHRYQATLGDPE